MSRYGVKGPTLVTNAADVALAKRQAGNKNTATKAGSNAIVYAGSSRIVLRKASSPNAGKASSKAAFKQCKGQRGQAFFNCLEGSQLNYRMPKSKERYYARRGMGGGAGPAAETL